MRGRIFKTLVVILLIFSSFLHVIPIETEAVGEPVVTIKFLEREEEQVADVRPGEHGTVQFPGTVEARLPAGSNIQDVVVNLEGYTGEGWTVEINPSTVQVDPGGTATFSATVSVPPETSSEISDTLTVEGTAYAFPGTGDSSEVPPAHGSIRIAQFFMYGLDCKEPEKQATFDEQIDFDLIITNFGNGKDIFLIDIDNFEKLKVSEITARTSTQTPSVSEKSFFTIKNHNLSQSFSCLHFHFSYQIRFSPRRSRSILRNSTLVSV